MDPNPWDNQACCALFLPLLQASSHVADMVLLNWNPFVAHDCSNPCNHCFGIATIERTVQVEEGQHKLSWQPSLHILL